MLKGFMVAPITYDKMAIDLPALKATGSNCCRWQFVRPELVSCGSEYDDWIDERLSVLISCLPLLYENKIKAIVDLHTPPLERVGPAIPGQDAFTANAQASFQKTWTTIAKALKNHSSIIGYDLMNEPPADSADKIKAWNSMSLKATSNIRKIEKSKIIFKSPPYGDPHRLDHLTLLNDPNWMLTVHMYYPFGITMQGVDARFPVGSKLYKSNLKDIEKYLQPVITFNRQLKIDVLIGEAGCSINSGQPNQENRKPWLRDCLDTFNKYGFHWCVHAWREADVWNLENQPQTTVYPADLSSHTALDIVKKRI